VLLNAGDEPGRAVEDAAGKLHLVLRKGGAVALIDPATATVTERKSVCPAPRGIAYEAATDRVHVACAGGELVSLPAAGGDAVRTITIERDLRDVVVAGTGLLVSTFRTAKIRVVNADGTLGAELSLPGDFDFNGPLSPAVAWRMMTLPDGRIGVVHQRGLDGVVQTTQGGYGGGGPGMGGCGGIVQSALSIVDASSLSVASVGVARAVLPVDFAAPRQGGGFAVLSSGNAHTPGLGQVRTNIGINVVVPGGPDMGGPPDAGSGGGGCDENGFDVPLNGEAMALAYDANDALWVQTREPAMLVRLDGNAVNTTVTVKLSTDSRADTGWAIFHSNAGANIACASCHPEGGEDARVWQFDKVGSRRTQTLRGHVGGTEPFHWGGELPTFDSLLGEVYLRRMAGPLLADDQKQALFGWIDAIPLLPQSPPADAAAVARGKTLFEDTTHAACTSCHSGPELTNNADADVGTGGKFQVPRLLGVGWRAPFLHDGCAATLTDRFGACGGTSNLHGVTSGMSAAQIADLVAYLQTL
jgi:mono/diheme cytochrome c family protein